MVLHGQCQILFVLIPHIKIKAALCSFSTLKCFTFMINLLVNKENDTSAINTPPPAGLVIGLHDIWLPARYLLTRKS